MNFAVENVMRVADEIEPLLEQHYEEVALNKDVIKLNPDWPRYFALEERGQCHVFTIRDDGVLVGYGVFFTSQHAHYVDTKVAANDILFLVKSHRRGSAAIRFIKFCEQALQNMGVGKITFHVKYDHDWSAILHRLGYFDEEKIVGKVFR